MLNDIKYISPGDCLFYENETGLIGLKYKGEDLGRVAVLKLFPLSMDKKMLSVRSENYERADNESEIGIIEDLERFNLQQQEIVLHELAKRYFMPAITKVTDVSEEFGHTMWKVETTAGKTEFTVDDMSSNVINLGNNRIMLIDVFSNRFLIEDVSKLEDKALKILEIWI